MTLSIEQFLLEKKQGWLNKKSPKNELPSDELLNEAESLFSPGVWIKDASKRVKQLHMVSHVAKLSHPDAKTSAFVAIGQPCSDGYVRTGNVDYPLDVYGNAAALDTLKFLNSTLSNGMTVLEAFEASSPLLESYINEVGLNFDEIAQAFLEIKANTNRHFTSPLVKQVYFPVGQGQYHLLSVLNSSGMMATLKAHIEAAREHFFVEHASMKNGEIDEMRFDRYFDLAKIGFGGTKPQNISFINNKEGGEFYLLPSIPPGLDQTVLRKPTQDFFSQILFVRDREFESSFLALDKLIKADVNNVNIRNGIRRCIEILTDQILLKALAYQNLNPGWTLVPENHLPLWQKYWLDRAYQEEAEQDSQWKSKVVEQIARWIISAYEKTVKNSQLLGDSELDAVARMVEQYVAEQEEFF